VSWFQVAKQEAISWGYCLALSRWRQGRKCGDVPLNADQEPLRLVG
jgi:hypothetical protein